MRGVDYYNRAVAFEQRADQALAEQNYRKALHANPEMGQAHNNLGLLLARAKNPTAAVVELDAALRLAPDHAEFFNNRATTLIALKRFTDAEGDLQHAVQLSPNFADACYNLGLLEAMRGEFEPAARALSGVVGLQANYRDAQLRLGQVLGSLHRDREAVEHLRQALQFQPEDLRAADALALLLATSNDHTVRNASEALAIAERANQMTNGESPALLDTLSVALAAQNRFDEAVQVASRAKTLAESSGQIDLARKITQRLTDYQQHRPASAPTSAPAP